MNSYRRSSRAPATIHRTTGGPTTKNSTYVAISGPNRRSKNVPAGSQLIPAHTVCCHVSQFFSFALTHLGACAASHCGKRDHPSVCVPAGRHSEKHALKSERSFHEQAIPGPASSSRERVWSRYAGPPHRKSAIVTHTTPATTKSLRGASRRLSRSMVCTGKGCSIVVSRFDLVLDRMSAVNTPARDSSMTSVTQRAA